MNTKQSQPKLTTYDACKKAFMSTVQDISRDTGNHHSRTFADFAELSQCSLQQAINYTEQREQKHLQTIAPYKDKKSRHQFPELLAITTQALELNPNADFLGECYGLLEIAKEHAGQFFTPYCVSAMMAGITLGDVKENEAYKQRGYITICEPCCGAGGMVIACANELKHREVNYQQAMYVDAIDIDRTCCNMAFIQLTLLGIPAVVYHGNTLSMEMWEAMPTFAFYMFNWPWRLRNRNEACTQERTFDFQERWMYVAKTAATTMVQRMQVKPAEHVQEATQEVNVNAVVQTINKMLGE